MKLKDVAPWKKNYNQPRQHIKKQRYYFANKGLSSQSNGFSSSHVWMWEMDCKESWVPKNWYLWTVVLGKTLESPLDCKEIQPVHPKGNQSWIFIGRTDAEAEGPILWPPDAKSWLIRKYSDAGKDWRQEEKGVAEDEMIGWHHWLNGHEFEQTQGDSEGQRNLVCCSSWSLNRNTSKSRDFPALPYLPEFAQTHVHWVSDAIRPSHPLSSPSPAFSLSQHQGLF